MIRVRIRLLPGEGRFAGTTQHHARFLGVDGPEGRMDVGGRSGSMGGLLHGHGGRGEVCGEEVVHPGTDVGSGGRREG